MMMTASIVCQLKDAIFLAPRGSVRRKRKTVTLPCVDNTVGRAWAILARRKKILGVKVWLLDVVQRFIRRADPLHTLGKFTDVEMVIANDCMVLINIAAHTIKLLPVGVGDPYPSPIGDVKKNLVVAVDKLDISSGVSNCFAPAPLGGSTTIQR